MRTPLSAIQGSSEVDFALRAHGGETQADRAADQFGIQAPGAHGGVFLNVERLSAGQMELKRQAIPVKEMVDVCVERVKPLGRAQAYRHRGGNPSPKN